MYSSDQTQQGAACFDPNIIPEQQQQQQQPDQQQQNNDFSHDQTTHFTPIHDQTTHTHHQDLDPSMELDQQTPHHLGSHDSNNWMPTHVVSDMGFPQFEDHQNPTSNTTTSDLLAFLNLPKCSFASSSSISFGKSSPPSSSSMGFLGAAAGDDQLNNPSGIMPYDHLFHLNLPSQPVPSLRDLMLQPFSEGFTATGMNIQPSRDNNGGGNQNGSIGMSSLFGMCRMDYNGDENINNGFGITGIYQHEQQHHMHGGTTGIFEFNSGNINPCLGDGKEGKNCPKNFVTERQRRQNFSDKYQHLKSLVPNPSKGDRASIVKDAIDYILELKRTVAELKLLVEKKRLAKERVKRVRNEQEKSCNIAAPGEDDGDQVVVKGVDIKPDPDEAGYEGIHQQLRSSWLQRKCKDTELDVRIVDDEVTIKLVQRKIKVNCLLSVSRTLDELQLDLRHVAGAHVGDYYSYLFNSKISEGSSVYASAIANKLMEAVERQYASASVVSLQPTASF